MRSTRDDILFGLFESGIDVPKYSCEYLKSTDVERCSMLDPESGLGTPVGPPRLTPTQTGACAVAAAGLLACSRERVEPRSASVQS